MSATCSFFTQSLTCEQTSPTGALCQKQTRAALATVFSMSELPKIAVVGSVASFLAVSPSALYAQSECNARQILQPGNCIGDDLDAVEIELAKQINDYRLQNGLPAIPLSPALSLVANRHVRDLVINIGRLTHDWSNCAMTDSNCMWEAPRGSARVIRAMGLKMRTAVQQDPQHSSWSHGKKEETARITM